MTGPATKFRSGSASAVPQNSGLMRSIKVVAPEGMLANPIFSGASHAGNGGGLILTGQQGNNFWVQVELFSGS